MKKCLRCGILIEESDFLCAKCLLAELSKKVGVSSDIETNSFKNPFASMYKKKISDDMFINPFETFKEPKSEEFESIPKSEDSNSILFSNPFSGMDFSGVPDIDKPKKEQSHTEVSKQKIAVENPFAGMDFSGVPDIDKQEQEKAFANVQSVSCKTEHKNANEKSDNTQQIDSAFNKNNGEKPSKTMDIVSIFSDDDW